MMKDFIKILIKKILSFFLGFCYSLLFFFKRSKKREVKYYFSVCAIFKNESIYLKEWIEYHKLIGVDHIYLYNNFSTDDYLSVLDEYITADYVTLTDWFVERGQMSAYENCYSLCKNETQWLMFLDLDEFICPKIDTDIKTWVKKYEKFPSVIVYWLMFGTNGIVEQDSAKLVIEQFTCSWSSVRNVGKIILNTNFEPVKVYHHDIFCKLNFLGLKFKLPPINENRQFVVYPGLEKCPKNGTIQINHYWSKSLNEYVRKIDKGDIFSEANEEIRKNMSFFYWHEHQNIAENKIIWRFLVELKVRLKSIEVKFK